MSKKEFGLYVKVKGKLQKFFNSDKSHDVSWETSPYSQNEYLKGLGLWNRTY